MRFDYNLFWSVKSVGDFPAPDSIAEETVTKTGPTCMESTWRCVSHVIDGSLHYLDNPEVFTRWGFLWIILFLIFFLSLFQRLFLNTGLYGASGNIWSGLLKISEVNLFLHLKTVDIKILQIQRITQCITAYEECLASKVISRQFTEDEKNTEDYDKKLEINKTP